MVRWRRADFRSRSMMDEARDPSKRATIPATPSRPKQRIPRPRSSRHFALANSCTDELLASALNTAACLLAEVIDGRASASPRYVLDTKLHASTVGGGADRRRRAGSDVTMKLIVSGGNRVGISESARPGRERQLQLTHRPTDWRQAPLEMRVVAAPCIARLYFGLRHLLAHRAHHHRLIADRILA